jgi:hypothetical protein
MHTPTHFVLNQKLLVGQALPTLALCDNPTPSACAAQAVEASVAVPGCSDTTWP